MISFRQFMKKHYKSRDQIPHDLALKLAEHGDARPFGLMFPTDMGSDFMGDALADDDFPVIKSFDQLYDYMKSCGACDGAIEGAVDTWRDYVLWRIREGEFETANEKEFLSGLKRERAKQEREHTRPARSRRLDRSGAALPDPWL